MATKNGATYVDKMMTAARAMVTDSNGPFIDMVENLCYAYDVEKFRDIKKFKAKIQSLRTERGRATVAENRLSESWSIGELGAWKCYPNLFRTIRKLPELPSMTGMYDIACAMRGTGSFGKDKLNFGKFNKWDANVKDAPTAEQLANAMKLANKARNVSKEKTPRTLDDTLKSMIDQLGKYRDGKVPQRNDKGETMKDDDGKVIKLAALASDNLTAAITALTKLKAEIAPKPRLVVDNKNGKAKRAARG